MEEITFNGVKYNSVEDMPPDVRQTFEKVMAGVGNMPAGINTVTTRKLVVNNREYGSADELPPDLRKLYDEAMSGGKSGLKIGTRGTGNLSVSFTTSTRKEPAPAQAEPGSVLPSDPSRNLVVLQDRLRWARTWIIILVIAVVALALAFLLLRQ